MSNENEQNQESPALKNFNGPLEGIKHVVGSTIKGAAKGALIGAGVLLALSALSLMNPLGLAGGAIAALTGSADAVLGTIILTGLKWGAAAGAAYTGINSVMNVEEVVDEKRNYVVASNEAKKARDVRTAFVNQQIEARQHMQPAVNQGGLAINSGLGARSGLVRGEGGPGIG